MLFFIKRAVKIRTLWKLFLNHIKKNCINDLIMFQINNTSFYFNYSVFFADSDASTMIAPILKTFCHKIESFFIRWANVIIVHDVYDILYAYIFDFFNDVFCIFADDFLNFDNVVNHLKRWVVIEKHQIFFDQTLSSSNVTMSFMSVLFSIYLKYRMFDSF